MPKSNQTIEKCCEKKHCNKCGTVDYFREIEDTFWSICYWNGDCYNWMGTVSANGYGVVSFKGRQWKAHRIAKALSGEFLPHWLAIDHLCRNTICVNPAHLRICTNAENVMAGESFSPKNKRKTHCPKGHSYADYGKYQKARKGNGTWRVCKKCKIIYKKLNYKSKKQKNGK